MSRRPVLLASLDEGKRPRGPIGPHGEARPDVAQLGQRQKPVQHRRFIGCHVAYDDLDEEVDVARNEMAGDHLWHRQQHPYEVLLAFGRMTADANSGEDGQAEPDGRAVHDRPIAFDRACLFQKLDPPGAWGRGQADPFGEHVVRQTGVRLELAKNLEVDRIQVGGVGRNGHEAAV